jgi:DNA-directed RNA polymerase specialized sigma24 family protein
MRVTEMVDYCYVSLEHELIHARLLNWERWVRVRPHGWFTHPMFRHFRASKQWETSPYIGTPVNTLDAAVLEKAVYALPDKHREAIRWWYVYRRDPVRMARLLGVSKQGLADLVNAGRTMLQNRLQK